jgi:hypothetical protein
MKVWFFVDLGSSAWQCQGGSVVVKLVMDLLGQSKEAWVDARGAEEVFSMMRDCGRREGNWDLWCTNQQ